MRADRVCARQEGKARTIELVFRSGLSPFFTIRTRPVTAPCQFPRPALLRESHRHVDGIRQCGAAGFEVPRADLRESARELGVARLGDHGDDRGALGLAEIGPAEPDEQQVNVALGHSAIASRDLHDDIRLRGFYRRDQMWGCRLDQHSLFPLSGLPSLRAPGRRGGSRLCRLLC